MRKKKRIGGMKEWKKLKEVVDQVFEKTQEDRKIMDRRYKQFVGQIWDEGELRKHDSRAFINMFFSTIEATAPLITDNRPIGQVVARRPYMQRLAHAYNNGLKYLWNVQDVQMKLLMAALDSMIADVGILKMYFSPDEDDVQIDVTDPRDFFIAPGYDEIWKAPFCGERSMKPISWIRRSFPDMQEDIAPSESIFNEKSKEWVSKYGEHSHFETDVHFAQVYEVWVKDDDEIKFIIEEEGLGEAEVEENYPNGAYVYFTDEHLLGVKEATDEHGKPPWIELKNYVVPHRFLGMGEGTQTEGLNKELNLQLQKIVDHAKKYGDPNWLVRANSGIDPEDYEARHAEGGQSFTYDDYQQDKVPPVMPIQVPPLNPTVLELVNLLPAVIEEITGVTDVSKGMVSKRQRQSASEIAMLLESSHTRVRQRVRNMEWTIKRLDWLAIRLMQQHYTEPRQVWHKQDNDVVYQKLGNSRAQAERMLAPGEDVQQRAQESGNLNVDLEPDEKEQWEDYQAFCEAFSEAGETDPIYFDFDIEIQTNSTLPIDKQSMANLALRLHAQKAIDTQSLLETLQWPNVEEVVQRIQKEAQEQGGGKMAQPGSPADMQSYQQAQQMMQGGQ